MSNIKSMIISIWISISLLFPINLLKGFSQTYNKIIYSKTIFIALKNIIFYNDKSYTILSNKAYISEIFNRRYGFTKNYQRYKNFEEDQGEILKNNTKIFEELNILKDINCFNSYEKQLIINCEQLLENNYISFMNSFAYLKSKWFNSKYLKCNMFDFFTNEKNVIYSFKKKVKRIDLKRLKFEYSLYLNEAITSEYSEPINNIYSFGEYVSYIDDFSEKTSRLLFKKIIK